ncbi:MAG: hypothetical protein OEV87_10565 [Phycisphaerae bacterium]|nr:hypothetical protein [Phycisphaerae bacterium]
MGDIAAVFKMEPSLIGKPEKEMLFEEANRLVLSIGKNWLKLGRIIAVLVKATSGATKKEREAEFEENLRLSYQQAMKMRRLYNTYKKHPHEVELYGLDVADRLAKFTQKSRRRIWKQTGSVAKVKQYLAEKKHNKERKRSTLKIKKFHRSQNIAEGISCLNYLKGGVLRIDFRKVDKKKFFRAISGLVGKELIAV